MKQIVFLTLITGFMGSAFICIDLGPFALFPARIFILLLWVVFIIRSLIVNKINYSHIKARNYLLFLFAWFILSVFSALWADSLTDVIRHSFFIFNGISLVFFVAWYLRDIDDYRIFVYLWLLVLIPLLALGYWNLLTGNYLENALTRGIIRGTNFYYPTAVFSNTNDFATYLALSIPFILIPMNNIRSKLNLTLGIPLLLFTLFLLLMTSSRANFLAIIMGLTFWFFFLIKAKEKIKIALACFLIILALSISFSSQTQLLWNDFCEQIGSVAIRPENQGYSDSIRTNLIRNGLILLVNHSLIGVGAGNTEFHMERFGVYSTGGITNMHNWWIEILVNYGIMFFIAYVMFYIKMFRTLWLFRKQARDKWQINLLDIALTGMVIFILASISSSSVMAFHPQWVFWAFCLGVINCCRLQDRRNAIVFR